MRVGNIKTIVTKEIRSYFDSPTAYIVLVLFLFLWEYLFFRGVFFSGEASLRILFDFLPWFLLFLVPALTMGSISQEKNDGTLELLLTLPLKSIELVIGKFLAAVCLIVFALLFALPMAWSLNSYGPLDWGVVTGQLLGGFGLVVVLASLGIFVSSFFSSQISALLVTIFVSFFLTVSGLGLVTDRMAPGIAKISEQLSLLTHYQSMVRGVIDTRDVFYFLSAAVVFLALAHLRFMKFKYGNKRKIYRNQLSTVVIIVGVVVLINVVGANIPGRMDLTKDKLYTLSGSTKDIISELEGPVEITLYISKELPVQVQPALREVTDIMRDYETYGGGNVSFTIKTPGTNKSIIEEAESRNVIPVRFNVIGNEELQVKKGYLGLSVSYGEEFESIPYIQNTGELEYDVTRFIKKLTVSEKKTIAYMSGYGQKRFGESYRIVQGELGGLYNIKSVVGLEKDEDGGTALDDVDLIILAGPTQPMEEELQQAIVDHVVSGGAALVFVDSMLIDPQTKEVKENEHSGNAILENFGITVQSDLVYDARSNETVTVGGGPINYRMPYPFFVRAISSADERMFGRDVKSLSLPWPSSIQVDKDKLNESGMKDTRLFGTTRQGGHQTEEFLIAPDQQFSRTSEGEYVLAMSFLNDETGGRMVVVGDSDFITDQFASNKVGNVGFALEAISWLAQDESLAQIRLKRAGGDMLMFNNQQQMNFIKYSNIGFAVALPLLIGSQRYWRRKKMQKKEYV